MKHTSVNDSADICWEVLKLAALEGSKLFLKFVERFSIQGESDRWNEIIVKVRGTLRSKRTHIVITLSPPVNIASFCTEM